MTHTTHRPDPDAHDSVYAGLLGNDAHWAFGSDFDDPLAGVDVTVPPDVDACALAAYCLMLGDDALVVAQRLAEWTSRAPDLEEDIAVANVALDLLGQARLLLARAAAADPGCVPVLPADSPVPDEDRLAYFRDAEQFRNVRLAELPNGDFAELVVRLLALSTWRLAVFVRLAEHPDPVLSAIAAKGVKELTYHRDFAARWVVTLAGGTDESRRRLASALAHVAPWLGELFVGAVAEVAVGVDPAEVRSEFEDVVAQVGLAAPDGDRPRAGQLSLAVGEPLAGPYGRDGGHTEALSRLLAEMQVVARAHPMGRW